MSIRLSAGRVRAPYEFSKAHSHECSARRMGQVLEVAPSGYYDWPKQPISKRAKEDARRQEVRVIQSYADQYATITDAQALTLCRSPRCGRNTC